MRTCCASNITSCSSTKGTCAAQPCTRTLQITKKEKKKYAANFCLQLGALFLVGGCLQGEEVRVLICRHMFL